MVNSEFKAYLEMVYWWKVSSYEELDGNMAVIELVMMRIIDHSAPFLDDGYPPREEAGRCRLYRFGSDAPMEPQERT